MSLAKLLDLLYVEKCAVDSHPVGPWLIHIRDTGERSANRVQDIEMAFSRRTEDLEDTARRKLEAM